MLYHDKMYFKWLLRKIPWPGYRTADYSQLLEYLFETEFTWLVDRDINRAKDGLSLREEFGLSTNGRYVLAEMPCTILEMMVALSCKIESTIMQEPRLGDRTGLWFWTMVQNMGLDWADDWHFNRDVVDENVQKIMARKSENDLFYCSTFDLKKWNKMEIWKKMTAWVNENYVF